MRLPAPPPAPLDELISRLERAYEGDHSVPIKEPAAALILEARALGHREAEVLAHSLLSHALYRRDDPAESARHAVEALELSRGCSSPCARVMGLVAWSRILWMTGELDEALRSLGEAIPVAEVCGDPRQRCQAHTLLGLVLSDLGRVQESLAAHEAAHHAAMASCSPDTALMAQGNLVGRLVDLGDQYAARGEDAVAAGAWQRAVELGRVAAVAAVAAGVEHGSPHLLVSLGTALFRLGRRDEALATFARQRSITDAHLDRSSLFHSAPVLAALHRGEGRPQQARQVLEEALGLAERMGARTRQAELVLALSELEEAEQSYALALTLYKQHHRIRERCAVEKALLRSEVLSVRMATERALHEAEAERRRAAELQLENQQLAARAAQLSAEALSDPLTGLANRRCMERGLTDMANAAVREGQPMVLAMVDVDRFKQVNDQHSHAVGDLVLQLVARVLRAQSRGHDLVGRYGGEEFLLAFKGIELAMAERVCERIRGAVQGEAWGQISPGLEVTVSIGLARLDEGPGLAACLGHADRRLYRAKQGGRNRVCSSG